MNLVFPALVVFGFILPGILFRWAFNKGLWDYPLGKLGPVAEQIPKAMGWAMVLNGAWAMVTHALQILIPRFVPRIDYDSVICWLSNNFGKDQSKLDRAIDSMARHPLEIFLYFVGLYVFSYGIGFTLHQVVRGLKLDWKYRVFRFDNDWHYLMKGEVLSFSDQDYNGPSGSQRPKVDHRERVGTVVAVVVDFKDRSYLYLGVLVDYFFDSGGNLERILLEGVKRRDLAKDNAVDDAGSSNSSYFDDRFYEVRGHYFLLRMSEIRTINVDYLLASDLEEAARMSASRPGPGTDGAVLAPIPDEAK